MFRRPLGSFERALYLSDAYATLNVVVVLQLESAPAPEEMAAALSELQRCQPALRARITLPSGQPQFEEMEAPSLPFTTAPRPTDEAWKALAESELSRRIDCASGPLFRSTYLCGPTRADLVLTFQHTIADAPSIAHCLHLLLAYLAAPGTPVPPHVDPLPAAESLFPRAFRGANLLIRSLGYAFRQGSDELGKRLDRRGPRPLPFQAGAAPRILVAETDEELTGRLVRRVRQERITLHSVLNAAMLMAVQRRLHGGRDGVMQTICFANLRPFVSPAIQAEALAAYFSMLRYTIRLDQRRALWEISRELQAQIYASLKRGDKYIAHMMSEGLIRLMTGLHSTRMATTALSYTGAPGLQPNYGSIGVRGLHAFISNVDFGPEYTAQVGLNAGRLVWDVVYLDHDMDRSQALGVTDEIQQILRSAAEST